MKPNAMTLYSNACYSSSSKQRINIEILTQFIYILLENDVENIFD